MIRSAFDDFIELSGPLAQLVERFHGMEEVAGPNPAWSTHKKNTLHGCFFLFMSAGFGREGVGEREFLVWGDRDLSRTRGRKPCRTQLL